MKNTIKNIVVGSLVYAGATVPGMSTLILGDNFDANTPTLGTFRIYESTVDNGWHRPLQGPSSWNTVGGQMQNDGTGVAGVDAYPAYLTGEGSLYNFFSGTSDTKENLDLTFDYSVAAGDTLYVHLWAVQGTLLGSGNPFIGNIEAGGGSLSLNEGSDGSTLDVFNLLDGATTGFGGTASAVGALTGSGSFSGDYFLPTLGIPGVANAADIDFFVLGFSKDEDGLAGTTTLDNLSFSTSVPEPSSLVLLVLGGVFLVRSQQTRSTSVSTR